MFAATALATAKRRHIVSERVSALITHGQPLVEDASGEEELAHDSWFQDSCEHGSYHTTAASETSHSGKRCLSS
jgi:hypothetical protein